MLLDRLESPSDDRFDLVLEAFPPRDRHRRGAMPIRRSTPGFFVELHLLATEGDGTEGLERTYKSVDTCAAEFEALTPYYYSSHERGAGQIAGQADPDLSGRGAPR